MKLTESFFERPSEQVAQGLVGRYLVRLLGEQEIRGRIIETAAYRGRTGRTSGEGIRYAPGKIYMMPYRGNNFFNVATEQRGRDACISVRGVEIDDEVYGPLQLTKKFQIGPGFDKNSINAKGLWIEGDSLDPLQIDFISPEKEKMPTNCLGYYRARG
ncbi:MAG TPA: DNA-3-methyladenine glycosylase [Candidatus Wunengus californicus]|uniref:DNA-3-methyladenine glycosylase n=1 Tax=Candidatus Wunengus californicus TaxID=3367619 RepID=UPI00402734A3